MSTSLPMSRLQLFAACLAFAHLLHAAPIPGMPTPLTVSSGVTLSSTSTTSTASPTWPSPYVVTSPSASSSPTPVPSTSTLTHVATDYVTITATQTAAPVTVTQTLLLTSTLTGVSTVTDLPTPTTEASSPDAAATVTPAPSPTAWMVPSDFGGNLSSALAVSKWAWGMTNVDVVDGIPSTAWAAPTSTSTAPSSTATATTNNAAAVFPAVDLSNTTAMKVLFPKGSINPANKNAPTGGTGMYMTPLDLSDATNVTLEYSVFFPEDFDFVKGGKLPGLYGGHTGCSGGAESEDCFSTRLMFRAGGKGEIYLYIPRDVQPPALCNTPPVSYCDTQYGLSIGRGAWTFKTGAWTTLRQEIKLNTPGLADGAFKVFANDELVISSDAVIFRLALNSSTSATPTPTPTPSSTSTDAAEPTTTSSDGGLLGGLLGGLGDNVGGLGDNLGDLLKRDLPSTSATSALFSFYTMPTVTQTETVTPTATQTVTSTTNVPLFATPSPLLPPIASGLLGNSGLLGGSILAPKKLDKSDATFEGIMFDTFFGGKDPSYAPPKDEYIYFNRIGLNINA
ncbi:hypothetical protein JCM1840_000131 [Sporobolomyces johnsonii]